MSQKDESGSKKPENLQKVTLEFETATLNSTDPLNPSNTELSSTSKLPHTFTATQTSAHASPTLPTVVLPRSSEIPLASLPVNSSGPSSPGLTPRSPGSPARLPHHPQSSVSFSEQGLPRPSGSSLQVQSPSYNIEDSNIYRGSYGVHSSSEIFATPSPSGGLAPHLAVSPLVRSRANSRTRSSGRITPAHSTVSLFSHEDSPLSPYRRRRKYRHSRLASQNDDTSSDDSSNSSSDDDDDNDNDDEDLDSSGEVSSTGSDYSQKDSNEPAIKRKKKSRKARKKKKKKKGNPQSYLERMLFGGGIGGDGMPVVRSGFGLEEFRDGFFDAIYSPISFIEKLAYESVSQESEAMAIAEKSPSLYTSAISSLRMVVYSMMSPHNGVKLFKAFITYFVAYILCVIGPVGRWLGHYRLFFPLACVLHQAAHSSGSQIEIFIQCAGGIALGLGVGSLSYFVSTSTQSAQSGYGGLQAVSVVFMTFLVAWVRASFIRLYHGMIAFHMAHLFMAVVNVSEIRDWYRVRLFAVPYGLGVALTLVLNLLIVPDFFHNEAFTSFLDAIEQCRVTILAISQADPEALAKEVEVLNKTSNDMSIVFREMLNEITISTVNNKQAIQLRNAIQMFIGRIRVVPCPTYLYGPLLSEDEYGTLTGSDDAHYRSRVAGSSIRRSHIFIRDTFQEPTSSILQVVLKSLDNLDKFLKYLKYPLPRYKNSNNLHYSELMTSQADLRNCQYALDMLSESLLQKASNEGVNVEWRATPVVNVLVYVHYLYDMSRSLGHVIDELVDAAGTKRKWHIAFPNYPFSRALKTNTRQTTHDRGGQSAFYFYHTKADIEQVFEQLHEISVAHRRASVLASEEELTPADARKKRRENERNNAASDEQHKLRYRLWRLVHRLQGYESRYAIRTSIIVTSLCIPGWIHHSRDWFNNYNLWTAPFIAVVIMHPRVGGNLHDLFVRTACAILGVVWAGISFRAHYGNPYVLCVMCAVFSKYITANILIPFFFS